MDDLASRLLAIPALKWHVHEAVVARRLDIDSERLSELLLYLKKGGRGSKRRRSWETSSHPPTDLSAADNSLRIKYAPYGDDKVRFFAIGYHFDRPTMKNQAKLLRAIVGEAKEDDEATRKRRQRGSLPWATGIRCPAATAFQKIDLPLLRLHFVTWFEAGCDREAVGNEIQLLLQCCNRIPESRSSFRSVSNEDSVPVQRPSMATPPSPRAITPPPPSSRIGLDCPVYQYP
jgi:hypothetical protein